MRQREKVRKLASRATNAEPQFLYSPAVRVSVDAAFGVGFNLQWDAYQRGLYTKINTALDRQASLLRQRGLVTEAEVRALVGQCNEVLLEARSPLSPFGRLYSEILKPSVGEVTTGGACLVGGFVGGLGLGALGAWGGEQVGATAYDYVTKLTWVRR